MLIFCESCSKNITYVCEHYVFIRPFAICMHGSSTSVAQKALAASSVELTREILSPAILPGVPLNNLGSWTHKGDDFRFSHMRNFIIFPGESETRGLKPVVGFYAHVTWAVVLSGSVSLTSLSGDNILTSRSRYWFFISISKPLLAVMGTPLGVDISVNPLTR